MSGVDEATLSQMIKEAPLKMIGARIRRARRESHLTLDELAELTGTSRQHLIRLEKPQHRPRPGLLARIATATGRDLDWFVDPEVDPSPFPEGGE